MKIMIPMRSKPKSSSINLNFNWRKTVRSFNNKCQNPSIMVKILCYNIFTVLNISHMPRMNRVTNFSYSCPNFLHLIVYLTWNLALTIKKTSTLTFHSTQQFFWVSNCMKDLKLDRFTLIIRKTRFLTLGSFQKRKDKSLNSDCIKQQKKSITKIFDSEMPYGFFI